MYYRQYWQDMINGTGDQYYVYPQNDTTVNVFDYKTCAEVRLLIQIHKMWGQGRGVDVVPSREESEVEISKWSPKLCHQAHSPFFMHLTID